MFPGFLVKIQILKIEELDFHVVWILANCDLLNVLIGTNKLATYERIIKIIKSV